MSTEESNVAAPISQEIAPKWTPKFTVTTDWLESKGACAERRQAFAASFPDGVEVTRENALKLREDGWEVEWTLADIAKDMGVTDEYLKFISNGEHVTDDEGQCSICSNQINIFFDQVWPAVKEPGETPVVTEAPSEPEGKEVM